MAYAPVAAPAVDLSRLQKLDDEGLISTQKHPSLDLLIHNYTPKCQYSKAWDEMTLMCRGLITDLKGRIVARGFNKFFNLSEHLGHEVSAHEGFTLPPINWRQNFVATKKHDGSLGILYFAGDQAYLSTRGSFTSDQAIRGTQIFRAKGYHRFDFPRELTFLWKIIFPQNRIVLDYGDLEECILLDVIEVETGRSVGQAAVEDFGREIGCPVVETIPATQEHLLNCSAENRFNEEGYVVRFEDGTRIKVKFHDYVRLHKLVTGVSARSIWENLMNGQPLDELLERVPDEFNEWVRNTVADLQEQYLDIESTAFSTLDHLRSRLGDASRKDYALEIVQRPNLAPILFEMLNGKDYAKHIWKKIKPASTRPFHQDVDA